MVDDRLMADLVAWLEIPSISTGGGDPADLERAARWVVDRVRRSGGEADLVPTPGNPLAVGELRADVDPGRAPTVLIYGHYDVQGPGDLAAWTSPPFAPEVRDGRLYARGAADDKGNFLPLLHAACELKEAGELPVHVRVLVEGEEERGSANVGAWVAADARGADVAIVFDSGMVDERTPAVTVGLRGLCQAFIDVRVGERDLHSGLYGGSVLNALHVVHAMLAEVVPGPDGRLREELREGIAPVSGEERASWAALPSGQDVLAEVGGRPVHAGAAAEFYERNGADASLDVTEVVAGEPRTIVPAHARASFAMRLAPGQDPERIRPVLERLLRGAVPDGAEVAIDWEQGSPALFPPSEPAIARAAAAIERATGTAPAFVRSGGSIPVVAELGRRMPVVVTGFVLPDDAFHAPDESFRLEALALGHATARELLRALADRGVAP
jgi:acetylornithine deacetylase/succinyl-diaminopimelate desuccinylase-like protein